MKLTVGFVCFLSGIVQGCKDMCRKLERNAIEVSVESEGRNR